MTRRSRTTRMATPINLTGSPSYNARIVDNGDPGSGCSSDPYKQFNTAAFSGPTYRSVGLESGRNVLRGCADNTLDLAIARNFPTRRQPHRAVPDRPVQCAQHGRLQRVRDAAAVEQPDRSNRAQSAVQRGRHPGTDAPDAAKRRLRRGHRAHRRCARCSFSCDSSSDVMMGR